jgi:hypothetical protein
MKPETLDEISASPSVERLRPDGRILVKPRRAAVMIDVSTATIYRMLATGELEKVVLPGTNLIRIPMDAIKRLRATK